MKEKRKNMENRGKICKEPNCKSGAKVKGYCRNHYCLIYYRRKKEMLKEELKKLEAHLKKRPDEKLINGYNKAMNDYKRTKDRQIKLAADIIKKEIDRRGLKI